MVVCVCVRERERGGEREGEGEEEKENLFALHYRNKSVCDFPPSKKLCYIGCSDKVSHLFVYSLKADKGF